MTQTGITIREIDKRYTYAKWHSNCAMDNCDRKPQYWLTRSNQHVCQSDLICSFHANIWFETKKIIDFGVSFSSKPIKSIAMSNIQIETDLKEVLQELKQGQKAILAKVEDIDKRLVKIETKLDGTVEDIKDIKGSQKAQICAAKLVL